MARFGLRTKAFVLVRYSGDEVVGFKVLQGIWQRFRSEDAVREYVRREVRAMLPR